MAKETRDALKGQATDVMDVAIASTGEFAHEATKNATEVASRAPAGFLYARDRLQEWSSEGAECVTQTAKTIAQDGADLIRKYPVSALLLGVAGGFFLSRALRN